MGRVGVRTWHVRSTLLGGAMLLLLAGCDPGHPFADVKLTVFSQGDGHAVVTVTARPSPSDGDGFADQDAILGALVERLALGDRSADPAPPEDREFDGPSMVLESVSEAHLDVSMAAVTEVLQGFGYPADASVFVSICAPATKGRASGEGTRLENFSSCSVWESDPRGATTDATAHLRFEERGHPWTSAAVMMACLSIITATAAFVRAVSSSRLRRLAMAVALVGILASGVAAPGVALFGLRANDTWFATGQTFDESVRAGFLAVAGWGFVGGAVVPLVILLVGSRRSPQGRQR